MNKRRQTLKYVCADALAAMIAWVCFFSYRKFQEPYYQSAEEIYTAIFSDPKFYLGLLLIPLCWIILYTITDIYRDVYRKSSLKEIGLILKNSLLGCILLFFAIILDDHIVSYTDYIILFIVLFLFNFLFICLFHIPIVVLTNKKIHSGKIGFNAILLDGSKESLDFYLEFQKQKQSSGTKFIGFISANGEDTNEMEKHLPYLGDYRNLPELIKKKQVEELVIAVRNEQKMVLERVFSVIDDSNLWIKILPKSEDYVLGFVNSTAVFHTPLMEIHLNSTPLWYKITKRTADVFLSLLAMIILLPLYLFLLIGVKCSSRGPVFFLQERIGYKGKTFHILKFRSMYVDAEKNGPQLSNKNDERITPFGRFMRKTHFDELPQFANVFKGDMSLVGYRPERQFYIDKIMKKAPYYRLLLLIKPGITSWGQVAYGYAENVEQMIERLRYDLLYLENMSLSMDIKILFYTVVTVLKGKGK